MSDDQPQRDAARLAERREFVRRSVLRANRAIGIILAVVLLLGVVLVVLITQSRRSQARAENAETEATERLWNSSLAQARAENLSTQKGHRAAALEAVRTAAEIQPSLELRNEAIAALAQRDLVPERTWDLKPGAYGFNFDPDLKYYVVRNTEEVLSMYRMEDNTHVRDFPMPAVLNKGSNVGDFQFSPTGRYVVIRYNGGAVALYETETGVLARLVGRDPRTATYSWPPTFTADDKLMCLTMTGSDGVLVFYDVERGEPRKLPALPEKFTFTGGFTNFLRLSPRGDLLAWYEGNNVQVLDAMTGALRQTITGPSPVQTVTWDTRGDRFVFNCDNLALFVWEAKTNRVVQMGGAAVTPWMQQFSRDGTLLMTSGSDGITRLWDTDTARLMCETSGALGHTLSPDGKRLAWGAPGRQVGVWRIEMPAAIREWRGSVVERATVWQQDLAPDGRLALWTPPTWSNTSVLEMLDFEHGGALKVPMKIKAAAGFRPSHRQVWTVGPDRLDFHDLPPDGLPEAAALESAVASLPLPPGFRANNASFSADGNSAAVSGANGAVIVVNSTAPDQPVKMEGRYLSHVNIPGPASPTGSGAMAISPDGSRVVAGRYVDRGNPIVWDAHTGKVVHRLSITESHLAFSPDGRYLATVGMDTGRLWSTGDWKIVWQRPRDELLQYTGFAAFSGDGSVVAWARGTHKVELLTIAGEPLAEWELPSLGLVTGLRFSTDGTRILAAGMEGRMLTIDLKSLRQNLAGLHLDWPLPDKSQTAAPGSAGGLSAWVPALLGIVPVGLAAVLGVLVLRRQGRLTHEFVEATEIASKRSLELAAEREVSELKSRFVSTVSHEFRTPLGITMSAIELMRHYGDRLDGAQREQLYDDIYTATRNMAGLMEQVLVLGRVDAGKLAYKPAALDLDTLARKLADESLSATNRKCPIEWRAENDLSGAVADESLLRHIFTNLLSNGVKYSPAGAPVHFSARREGLMAVFTVKDSGIGIPDQDLPHLFEAFHRGSNVGDIPGTGLGLVIIKRCADLHRGSIQVKSTPGEGTTFTVRIPAWV